MHWFLTLALASTATVQPLVDARQQAMAAADWSAVAGLLHPEARGSLCQGFDDVECAGDALRRAWAAAGAVGGGAVSPLRLRGLVTEGACVHGLFDVEGSAQTPERISFRRHGEALALEVPTWAETVNRPCGAAEPLDANAAAAWAVVQEAESLKYLHRDFMAYAVRQHPVGLAAAHAQFAAMVSGWPAPEQARLAPILQAEPAVAFAQVTEASVSMLDTTGLRFSPVGVVALDRHQAVLYRASFPGSSFLWIQYVRPHDGVLMPDPGAVLEGRSSVQLPAQPNPVAPPPPLPEVRCEAGAPFVLRAGGTELLCASHVRDVRRDPEGRIRLLLSAEGRASLVGRSRQLVGQVLDFVVAGKSVGTVRLIEPLDTWVVTLPVVDEQAWDALSPLAARRP